MLVNILKNGSIITVTCKGDHDHVVVSVSDQGVGIKKEDIDRLFERYFRVTNNSVISGFGIGLYLSAEIIKRHQGKIWVESELGRGVPFISACHCIPVAYRRIS